MNVLQAEPAEDKPERKNKVVREGLSSMQSYVKQHSVLSPEAPSPYRAVRIEGWTPHNTANTASEGSPATITASEGSPVTINAGGGYPATIPAVVGYPSASSVYKVADELELFEDSFDRSSTIITPHEDLFTKGKYQYNYIKHQI